MMSQVRLIFCPFWNGEQIQYEYIIIDMLTQVIKYLEYVNIGITVLFLGYYIYRFISLRHLSVTDRYKNKYPMGRFVLCAAYFIISIPFLVLSIVWGIQDNPSSQFWVLQQGIGEFVDAIILIIQCIVLKNELSKQKPYTKIHVIFSIYLTLISIARFVIVLVNVKFNEDNTITSAFYLAFLINSILILGFWIVKKQELPQFQENNYINFEQFRNADSRYLINRDIQISYLRKISESFHYIHPIVSVEKNRFRIILQIYDNSNKDLSKDQTHFLERNSRTLSSPVRTTRKQQQKQLIAISNKIFSIHEIMELYKVCGRFNIKQTITFDSNNLVETYKNLQNYLQQLFSQKKHYMNFVLGFFDLEDDILERYERELRTTLKGSELDISAHLDVNGAFISIRIYKQLWIDDHYLFYMDVAAADGSFQSRPMKRYTDFQSFYNRLYTIIKRKYAKFVIPDLPQKYLFNWDQSKINHRRIQLEYFIRNIANDYKIMLQMPQLRQVVLNFLLCQKSIQVSPRSQRAIDFIKGLQVMKGQILKNLVGNQYVTFYQFKFYKNGIPIRNIKKRYSDFQKLHEALERHMYNTQIFYKFVILPQKHLYKSGPIRHEKLKAYLSNMLTIAQIWKVYDVLSFIHIDSNLSQIDVSRIDAENSVPIEESPNFIDDSRNSEQYRNKNLIDERSMSSNQRMSALIDELG